MCSASTASWTCHAFSVCVHRAPGLLRATNGKAGCCCPLKLTVLPLIPCNARMVLKASVSGIAYDAPSLHLFLAGTLVNSCLMNQKYEACLCREDKTGRNVISLGLLSHRGMSCLGYFGHLRVTAEINKREANGSVTNSLSEL